MNPFPLPRDRRLLFELAREGDDPELRRLLRDNPMEGEISLSLECEPSFFRASAVLGDVHQVVVARDEGTGRLQGMGARAILDAYVNGARTRLGYLSQLRLDRGCRARPGMLGAGYRLLRELHGDGLAPFYVTTIVEDNRPARRILEAGVEGLPAYRPLEPFVTLALPVKRAAGQARAAGRKARPAVRRARPGDLDAVVDCLQRSAPRHQFAPCWTRQILTSPRRAQGLRPEDFHLAPGGGGVGGCLAIWDQRGFKQTVVRGYGRRLRLARPLLNALSPWLRAPGLPPPGGEIGNAFVSHIAMDEDDPDRLLALLASALADADERRLDYLILGLTGRHPLLATVRKALPHRQYVSIIYLVHWADGAGAAAAVDGRIPHLEVAIL